MHADTTDHQRAIDHRGTLAHFRSADGAFLSRGAAADYHQVELLIQPWTRLIGLYSPTARKRAIVSKQIKTVAKRRKSNASFFAECERP